ncbi:helix-turn-helix domain-containing protein [Gracilibacillus sp. YIM 98692]|uniref:PucR family transcriptional regulator n=1 Tax=Gracilibacillus sp. YIM 98692 TaxID=2663532 RepID=UPI0013CFD789|nr:helix-turn-helix domain-containing protein [Gracilibacillus sp. YIM 98692]
MYTQLEELFTTIKKTSPNETLDTTTFKWFVTNDSEIIGIPKNELSKREEELLGILLTPYKANQPPTTSLEKLWMDVLFHQEIPKSLMEKDLRTYHFVYFSLSDEEIDPESFREAIHGLFPEKTPILWENNHEGVIIRENHHANEEKLTYNEIIEVLTTDFYMDTHLFVGPTLYDIKQASRYYQWIKKCYALTKKRNYAVIHYIEAIPYLLLHDITDAEQKMIVEPILHHVQGDEELLKTIQVFLESNSNTTLAAKKMYMHRNSLQYRVDKFIEKTGIDVKKFDGSIAVYLCLLMRSKW